MITFYKNKVRDLKRKSKSNYKFKKQEARKFSHIYF